MPRRLRARRVQATTLQTTAVDSDRALADWGPVVTSPAEHLCEVLASTAGGDAALQQVLARLTRDELAALAYDWDGTWAREKQIPPDGPWRSWGFLGAAAMGKTRAIAEFVTREAHARRAMQVALIAQTEDKVWEVMVENPKSGLIAVSPPWFKARVFDGKVVWPNGAQAQVYTPERPDRIFGDEYHLAWATEIHAWPRSTMKAAFDNLKLRVRLGYGRFVYDTNPRRRHPLIRSLIDRNLRDPRRHVIVRGTTYENKYNIAAGAIEDWEAEIGGTQLAREMLLGIQSDDDDAALFRQEWIDNARRQMPSRFTRRVLSVDPAVSMREGTDPTGIVEAGLATDDQVIVIDDLTDRLEAESWARLVVRRYFASRCDCCIVERNRGGDLPVAMLRAACVEMGFELVVLPLEAETHGHKPGVMYVKEVVSRQSKEVRADGVVPLYERGLVSHVDGPALSSLEDEMCSFVPGPKVESPNRMDAMVHAVWELKGMWRRGPAGKAGFRGLDKAHEATTSAAPTKGAAVDILAGLGVGGVGWSGGL